MAVVIRLQGLPVSAGTVDIRHFFSGLKIPDGGVHIIGGKLGEAFIIFATDEDARRAMSRTGGVIKNLHVTLVLSSKTEMQSTLEMSRKANKNPKHPAVPPGDTSRLEMAKKGGNQSSVSKHNESYVQKCDKKDAYSKDVYVSCYGLPFNVTMEDMIQFFKGLDITQVIFQLRENGLKTGIAFVKFASATDADGAMKFNNEYIRHRFISIAKSTEDKWLEALNKGDELHCKPKSRARSRSPQNQQFYVHLKNLPYIVVKQDIRHFFSAPDITDSQIKFLLDKSNNRTREGFVMLKSERQYEKCLALSKKELKGRQVFIFPIARKVMLELIESYETQTLPKQRDMYEEHPQQRDMYEEHPPQRDMYEEHPPQRDMYEEHPPQRNPYEEHPPQRNPFEEHPPQRNPFEEHPQQRNPFEEHPQQRNPYVNHPRQRNPYENHPQQRNPHQNHPQRRDMYEEYPQQRDMYEEYPRGESSNLKRCVYLRNFPFDVSKVEVQKFFDGFLVHEDNIFLLFDNKGVGLGEALVRFQSEEQAMRTGVLNRQHFLGTEVFLTRISDEQAKEFGAFNNAPVTHPQGYKDEYINVPLPQAHENSYMGPNYDRREFRSPPDRREFRSPPERQGSYAMELGGRDESFDRFDSGNPDYNDYENSFSSPPRNFDGGSSGAIIRMRNLPYTITNEEILNFFYGYNIIPDSIDVKFNRKGMSTGHATVCSPSYEEALTAVKELSDRPIGSRNILLSLTRI
ncbi:RNA-binding protein 12B-B-like [Ranitomeya imitator]|uniref:RNA-binding protein 12B-B-like n=1 Tax=Ranitomeya imitator TaxID=111125 RepID=UPI0037E8D5D0